MYFPQKRATRSMANKGKLNGLMIAAELYNTEGEVEFFGSFMRIYLNSLTLKEEKRLYLFLQKQIQEVDYLLLLIERERCKT